MLRYTLVAHDITVARSGLNRSLGEITSRADLQRASRIVIKAGTTTTTDSDGYPALRRVTSLIEQMALLRRQGKEVIFIASGAVGYGRCVQRRQRILLSSALDRMYDTDNSKLSNTRKSTLAAIGQSAMMNLYINIFQQLDTPIGELLLTHHDFLSQDRTDNVIETLNGFMTNGIVPIVNENDAVTHESKRKYSPFDDNDGLASLVASHMRADLLLLLTDVDGLYDRSPDDPNAQFISTWETREVQFGEKSSMGRGGMQSKVDAAMKAISHGVPAACICSGQRHGTILNVTDGKPEGTLFVKNPEKLIGDTALNVQQMLETTAGRQPKSEAAKSSNAERQKKEDAAAAGTTEATSAMVKQAKAAREGSRALCALTSAERSRILNCVADALKEKSKVILDANKDDVERETKNGTLAAPLLARLKLTEEKLDVLCTGIRSLASSKEPVGRVLNRMELAEGAILRQETTPIGVLLIVFESRPDALVQIASLALRSCNGLLLKGGKEAVKSNAALHKVIVDAVYEASKGKVPRGAVGLVETRSEVGELLSLDKDIDLVIPRGSNQLVRSTAAATKIPVLGHAEGLCHTYVDRTCEDITGLAVETIVDAKLQYPAACNATETLLIDAGIPAEKIRDLLHKLSVKGIELRGGPKIRAAFPAELPHAAESLFIEYGDSQLGVELVDNSQAAINHINEHGSHHTDAILSDDEATCKHFTSAVDSACVFMNASTRMADGYRFGLGAEVGISTGRIHARGPVGVEGLLSQKWVLESPSVRDRITADAFAKNIKKFTHRPLPVNAAAEEETSTTAQKATTQQAKKKQ